MDVYGIQKKSQIKLNDSLNNMINNIKLPLINLKEQKQFFLKKIQKFYDLYKKKKQINKRNGSISAKKFPDNTDQHKK